MFQARYVALIAAMVVFSASCTTVDRATTLVEPVEMVAEGHTRVYLVRSDIGVSVAENPRVEFEDPPLTVSEQLGLNTLFMLSVLSGDFAAGIGLNYLPPRRLKHASTKVDVFSVSIDELTPIVSLDSGDSAHFVDFKDTGGDVTMLFGVYDSELLKRRYRKGMNLETVDVDNEIVSVLALTPLENAAEWAITHLKLKQADAQYCHELGAKPGLTTQQRIQAMRAHWAGEAQTLEVSEINARLLFACNAVAMAKQATPASKKLLNRFNKKADSLYNGLRRALDNADNNTSDSVLDNVRDNTVLIQNKGEKFGVSQNFQRITMGEPSLV